MKQQLVINCAPEGQFRGMSYLFESRVKLLGVNSEI